MENFSATKAESCLSLIVPVEFFQDKNGLSLIEFLANQRLIQDVFVQGNILKDKTALPRLSSSFIKKLNLHFEYTPDIRGYLADHPDQLRQLIRRRIFSTADYTRGTESWNSPLTHFFGKQPALIELQAGRKTRLHLPDHENIVAIFAIAGKNSEESVITDVLEYMNKQKGSLILPSKFKTTQKLLIVRSFQLQPYDPVSRLFNFYNLSHARMLQEVFSAKIKKHRPAINGLFLNINTIFQSASQMPWPEYDYILEKTAPGLLKNIALGWLKDELNWRTEYNLARKKFFKDELYKDLIKMTKQLTVVIPVDHELFVRMEPDSFILPEIDARKFITGSHYFFRTLLLLKRYADRLHFLGEKTAAVIIHDLLNLRFSYSDKAYHLNYLNSIGINHFYFTLGNRPETADEIPADFSKNKDKEIYYLSDWLAPFQQTGAILKDSFPHSDFLVLYPVFDSNLDPFHGVMQILDKNNLDYSFIDFDLFLSDEDCRILDNKITLRNAVFPVILLPAVHVLPLAALEKLENFILRGGIVLALGSLPQAAKNPKDQTLFSQMKKRIWFEGSEPGGTSFIKHDSGGLGLYQKDLNKLDVLWDELGHFQQFLIKTYRGNIRHTTRETKDIFYLLLFNPNQEECHCDIESKVLGRPYLWNFDKGEAEPCVQWHIHHHKLIINQKIAGNERRLLLLQKDEPVHLVQLVFSNLDGHKLLKQEAHSFALDGWSRKSGQAELLLQHKGNTKKISKIIPEKLYILRINSNSWYLESKSYKGNVRLGDHSKLYPFQSESLTYQKIIVLDSKYTCDYQLFLDLGKVKDWCQVHINEKYAGRLFSAPFIFDVSGLLKDGENKLSITVFNSSANRLAQTSDDYPMREYGLFGPVKITPYGKISVDYIFD